MINFYIKRGHDLNSEYIPHDGELCWGKDTNRLFIGDGKTPIKELKGFNNICKSPSGKLFLVYVDDDGKTTVEQLSTKYKDDTFEFYIKE